MNTSAFRTRITGTWQRFKQTVKEFISGDPFGQAAGIAYYTLFSMPAVLILTVMVASSFYDEAEVRHALLRQSAALIGPATAEQVGQMLEEAGITATRSWARLVAIVTLVFSAGSVFASLQSSLNKVWEVTPKPGRAIFQYLFTRLISLALVACFGFLILVSLVLDTALVAFAERSAQWFSAAGTLVITILNIGISIGLITLIFALLFRTLPDAEIRWRDVWGGALLTAVLFSVGKYLISFYINYSNVGDAYGAAGAVVIILVWIYYSTVIMLFGAHYTHVRTRAMRGKVEPSPHAAPDKAAQDRSA